jgi:hypothetical protein
MVTQTQTPELLVLQGDYRNGPQPQKTVLSSCPGKDGTSSSETKQNKRMAVRPGWLVLNRLQKQTAQPQKTVLVRAVPVAWKSSIIEEWCQLFVSKE